MFLYDVPWYKNPINYVFGLMLLMLIFLFVLSTNNAIAESNVGSCVHKGVITDFADINMVQLDNDKWIQVKWAYGSSPRGWDRKIYEGSSALKCVGHGLFWNLELWRIGR